MDRRYPALLFLAGLLLLVFFFNNPEAIPFHTNQPKQAFTAVQASSQPKITPEDPSRLKQEKKHHKSPKKVSFPGFPIDLNRASREELMLLPGVGEKTAGRILEKRKELGGFKSVDDLMEVKGIGPVKYERMQPLVKVSAPYSPKGG